MTFLSHVAGTEKPERCTYSNRKVLQQYRWDSVCRKVIELNFLQHFTDIGGNWPHEQPPSNSFKDVKLPVPVENRRCSHVQHSGFKTPATSEKRCYVASASKSVPCVAIAWSACMRPLRLTVCIKIYVSMSKST